MTRVTDMGPVSSAVRSSVQTLGTSPQPSAGIQDGGSAARNGARVERAVTPQTKQAVAPATGAARSDATGSRPAEEPCFAVESAKARAQAAQRAYMMASLAAGLNPLNDRLR